MTTSPELKLKVPLLVTVTSLVINTGTFDPTSSTAVDDIENVNENTYSSFYVSVPIRLRATVVPKSVPVSIWIWSKLVLLVRLVDLRIGT